MEKNDLDSSRRGRKARNGGIFSAKSSPAKSKSFVVFFRVLTITFFVIGAGVAGTYLYLSLSFSANTTPVVSAFPEESTRPPKAPTVAENILLLGSDTRGEIGTTLESAEGARSDTIMVVHLPADRKSIQLMSIMRDSWVDIPGFGENKINAAMSFGGIPLTVQTVEAIIQARIDHVAVIDFSGVKELSDSLGGVVVKNDIQFSAGSYTYPSGRISVSGEKALTFVRERHAFIDGDYQRVKNQQKFMEGVFSKILSRDVLTNPGALANTLASLGGMLAIDPGVNFVYVANKAIEFRDFDKSALTVFTLPSTGTGMVGDQSVVFVDWREVKVLRRLFANDGLSTYVAPSF
jgi:LCP family protein required for cell wall assembly